MLLGYKVNEGFLINLKGRLNNLLSICRAFSSDGKFESLSGGILQNLDLSRMRSGPALKPILISISKIEIRGEGIGRAGGEIL